MRYVLTEAGKFRLQYLTILYLKEAAKLYTESREIFGEVLDTIKESVNTRALSLRRRD
ncbi:hypothetical protein [Mesotoga sp.]|uniref:hypothetical protein n=1 Tax=Mesotoga sp. TaxID=2053577 RepID=UPI00345E872B